ncbi:hypothetical protein MTO96_029501 [Rhipicephalus appendiculatus]
MYYTNSHFTTATTAAPSHGGSDPMWNMFVLINVAFYGAGIAIPVCVFVSCLCWCRRRCAKKVLHRDVMYKYPDYNYGRVTTPAPTESTDVVAVAMSVYTIAYIVTTITIIVVVVCCCICWCKRCCQRCCKKKPPPPQPQRRPSPVVVYRAPPSPKPLQVYTVRTVTVATVQPVAQPQVTRVAACTVREVAAVK